MAQPPRERFGRYELVSRLGRGGMAETWRARLLGAAGVTKPVLIKKVLDDYAKDDAFIAMFISEARISATLSHGNIAQVFDFGRADGDYFLAMEFVDGQPLNRIIKRALKSGLSAIPVPLATFIALEMCRGLHYAHTRRDESGKPLGIVHRDISPDNVLVSYEGQVKIVDFGIAKARALRGFDTEPGVVKGKYLFFSPEQGRGHAVDARADVWATGVVLYEMLCGQLPVVGPAPVAQPRLMKGDFPRPREVMPGLPKELDDIVMRALEVDVRKRFASSHAFGDALAGFLYSAAPRFSAISVAHLVQELFREDLTADGREVQVPRTFLEELSLWRMRPPARDAASPARVPPERRPTTPTAPAPDSEEAPASGAPRSRVGPVLATVGVVALLSVGAALVLPGLHARPVEDPSPRQPVNMSGKVGRKALESTRAAAQPPAPAVDPAAVAPARIQEPEPEQESEPTSVPEPEAAPSPPPAPSDKAKALYEEGTLLIRKQRFAEADSRLSKCIEVDPAYASCYLMKGTIAARLGHLDEGAKYYREFLRLAPNHERAPQVRKLLADYDKSRLR